MAHLSIGTLAAAGVRESERLLFSELFGGGDVELNYSNAVTLAALDIPHLARVLLTPAQYVVWVHFLDDAIATGVRRRERATDDQSAIIRDYQQSLAIAFAMIYSSGEMRRAVLVASDGQPSRSKYAGEGGTNVGSNTSAR